MRGLPNIAELVKTPGMIGLLTPEERKKRIERFMEKRRRRFALQAILYFSFLRMCVQSMEEEDQLQVQAKAGGWSTSNQGASKCVCIWLPRIHVHG